MLLFLGFLACARSLGFRHFLKGAQRFAGVVTVVSGLSFSPVAPSLLQLSPVFAANNGAAGSKTDKGFESCVSKCIFSETRPPPIGSPVERLEARGRVEVITGCRKSCAKTPEQLMLGEPKIKKTKAAAPAGQE